MTADDMPPARVSVLMPTYRQALFIARAIESLLAQSLESWRLIIIDDGSPDDTEAVVSRYIDDPRINYHRFQRNRDLGAALNWGLDRATTEFAAYLPSDDLYHRHHLEELIECLDAEPHAVAAYSGVRYHYNRSSPDVAPGEALQLVQVVHRATPLRWIERPEFVTDDLDVMFWNQLREVGTFAATGRVTAEWVDHPGQRHKRIREPEGGINPYRVYYGVKEPLRFQTSVGNRIDEVGRYRHYRDRPATPKAPDGLRIVLAGELAYNADRVLALEERGHELFGLWMPNPQWYNTVGPLPFGHVVDLPDNDVRMALTSTKPDVVYALLNWQAVPFACHVLRENPGVPFVWHFKEGPFICLERGTWPDLMELTRGADGLIFSSPEMRDWFTLADPTIAERPTLILDGDLPKRDWFRGKRAPRLSFRSGEVHTVVPGRPIGLHPETVAELAAHRIHLHFYGDFTHGQWRGWIERARLLAPEHLHLHANVDQEQWVDEFSQFDAGWLHTFESDNRGDLARANWDDLNVPARMATLAVAGLPMIQWDNTCSIVATHRLAKERNLGIQYQSIEHLSRQLHDTQAMEPIRESVWLQRAHFTFDEHADRLMAFLRAVVEAKSGS